MEETAPRRNNLPLPFLHFDVASTGGAVGRAAQSSRRSLDQARFVSRGRLSALSRVVIL